MQTTVDTSFEKISQTITDKLKSAASEVKTKLTEMVTTFTSKLTSIKTNVTNEFSNIVNTISNKLGAALSTATSKLAEVTTAFQTEAAKWSEAVADGVAAVKAQFGKKFDWGIPELKIPVKTPVFSVSGKWEFDDKGNVSGVPRISVQWYKRAAEMGALFTEPALVGVGDAAQPEMLIGEDTLYQSIKQAVMEAGAGGFEQTINITAPRGLDASETARLVRNNTREMLARMRGGIA